MSDVPLTDLPDEIIEHIFLFCGYETVLTLKLVSSLCYSIAGSHRVHFNALLDKYRHYGLQESEKLLHSLLDTRSPRELNAIVALLTLNPSLATSKPDGQELPIKTCRLAVLDILLYFGAEPSSKCIHNKVKEGRDDLVRRLCIQRKQLGISTTLDKVRGSRYLVSKGSVILVKSLLPFCEGKTFAALSASLNFRSLQESIVSTILNGSRNHYLLHTMCENGLDFNMLVGNAPLLFHIINSPPQIFKLLVYQGMKIEISDQAGKLVTNKKSKLINAAFNVQYCRDGLKIIKEITGRDKKGRVKEPPSRDYYLQLDYGYLLLLERQDLFPYADSQSFWREKFSLDFPWEVPFSKKEGRDGYFGQLCTVPILAYVDNELRCMTFPFWLGRGFIYAYLILFLEGVRERLRVVAIGREGASLGNDVDGLIEMALLFGFSWGHSSISPEREKLLPLLEGEFIALTRSNSSLTAKPNRSFPFKSKSQREVRTEVLTMPYKFTITSLQGDQYELQFSSVDFLRGCIVACNLFGLEARNHLSLVQRVRGIPLFEG